MQVSLYVGFDQEPSNMQGGKIASNSSGGLDHSLKFSFSQRASKPILMLGVETISSLLNRREKLAT